jgi:hypothetical protein
VRFLRPGIRWANVLVALVTLASGLATLGSDLLVAGYREAHHDALWFVVAYCAVQAWMVVAFARENPSAPWLASAKLAAALLFFATIPGTGLYWAGWTPGRYVYQLFDWGGGSKVGLFALAFLGRGAFNTVNTLYWTARWWRPLRERHPLVGRAVTSVGIALAAVCVSLFFALASEERRTFSDEAQAVAQTVLAQLDCQSVRANDGKTTQDLRQQGERRYLVEISYGCEVTRVVVRTEDGKMGVATGTEAECCRQLG